MHCTDVERPKARKPHRCMSCGDGISVGETYVRWRCYDGGDAGTNKMHPECLAMHEAEAKKYGDHEWEYSPYSHERPKPDDRPCTCNPGDKSPQPCAQQYALLECRAAASEKPRAADHGAPAAQHQHKGYIAGLPGWNYPDAGDPLPAGGDKCLLLTKGGVCIVGAWSNGVGLLAWSPMPKRDKTKEAAHGIAATESHSWPKR